MIQIDNRIGGYPKYILTELEKQLMFVPDEVRKCVGFIGFRNPIGAYQLGGTVFFVGRPIEGVESHSFTYAVTAKHVIDEIKENGVDTVCLRLNFMDGKAHWLETDLSDWLFHPEKKEVDVAVLPVGIPEELDHLICPISSFATEETIAKENIGIGEEVFLSGLFAKHHGRQKNIPVLRVGNIAAMPEEPIETELGMIDAYLVEARSIGGLSGSPVFVHLGSTRVIEGQLKFARQGAIFYLLGLMHGLTKASARELATSGITCNAIAPGFIETDMTAASTQSEEDKREAQRKLVPLGRFGQPDEVAALAVYLASDEAAYVTASNFSF